MAKQSEFTRALANLDAQIEKLKDVKAALLQARDQIPKRASRKPTKPVAAKEPAA